MMFDIGDIVYVLDYKIKNKKDYIYFISQYKIINKFIGFGKELIIHITKNINSNINDRSYRLHYKFKAIKIHNLYSTYQEAEIARVKKQKIHELRKKYNVTIKEVLNGI